MLPQIGCQRTVVEAAKRHRVSTQIAVQRAVAHQVNGGFKYEHRIAVGRVWQAEPDGLVAAGDVTLEAAALVIGPALVGEDGFAGLVIAHEHAVVVLSILIQQTTGDE